MNKSLTVIGSGPGGYESAVLAAKNGLDVKIIERKEIGGVCTNRGCIPSKALLSVAERIDDVQNSRRKGLDATLENINFDRIKSIKNRAVMTSRKGIENQLEENDVEIIKGEGKLVDKGVVEVDGKTIESDYIIIATGSKPIQLPSLNFDKKNILTSDDILEIDDIPESMVIIGGGYIGIEMAFVFSSLGTDVTIVELMNNILPNMDKDLSEETVKILKRKKIRIYTGSKVTDVEGDGPLDVTIKGDTEKEMNVEKVLCCVGRIPTPPEIKIEGLKGGNEVKTDGRMRTSVEGIYAVGDVNGKSMLAHSAYKQAEIAVEDILGDDPRPFSEYEVPAGVYTHPEIASVGFTEDMANKKFDEIKVGKFPISASGRGYSTGERSGLAKVIASKNKIVGIHLMCPGATDIIMEGTVAMQKGVTIKELSDIIHPHPTYSESIKNAAKEILEQ